MSLRKRLEEEDYYCLVQCDCGRKYKQEDMLLCYLCQKLKCNYCLITEPNIFQCKANCSNSLSTSLSTPSKNRLTCEKCLECPICFIPLIKKTFYNKHYLYCTSCFWNSSNVHISEKKEKDFEIYISTLYQHKSSGFFKRTFDEILTKLNNENIVYKEDITKDPQNLDCSKSESDYNIVQKAMENSEQNFEEFSKRIKEDISNTEKKMGDKYEYNDNYLNKEGNNEDNGNKYILKNKNKIMCCYNDFNQNLNSLEEVKKAFINSNSLNINFISSLEQRHNNLCFQNNIIWNQFPNFVNIIPKKKIFYKKCKECGVTVIQIPENPTEKDCGILQSYLSTLPLILINKIDWEKHSITLKFIMIKFVTVRISFKNDPKNKLKITLPKELFNVENQDGQKNILIDFKVNENFFVKGNEYIFRFIVKAEYNRESSEDWSCIEYPVEIKFK